MEVELNGELKNNKWFSLFCDVIRDVLPKINKLEEQKRYIGSYFNFPSLSYNQKGFPSIYKSSLSSTTDYSRAFSFLKDKEPDTIYLPDLASYRALFEYSNSEQSISQYFAWQEAEEANEKFLEYRLYSIITDLVNRYKHSENPADFDPSALKPIYKQLEIGFFSPQLQIDIVIPIVLTKFEQDMFVIDDVVRLERIDNSLQLSRGLDSDASVNINIVSAATHALRLKNFWMKNSISYQEEMYGINWTHHFKEVEDFLAATRIAANIHTGYAQTIFQPVGWAKDYTAHLQYLVFGPTFRRFPSVFENNYWHKDITPLSSSQLDEIKELYIKISQSSDNQVGVAVKRLNTCFLREEEEDIILDAMTRNVANIRNSVRDEYPWYRS